MINTIESSIGLFLCPLCQAKVSCLSPESLACESCSQLFKIENGIPLMFCPNQWDGKSDVTERIKAFYEETPFPNYDDIDSKYRLIEKAETGLFANLLNKQIRYGLKVLEAGCGTGQLSNFLGIAAGRLVFGADMCLNSLRLANQFRRKNEIENVMFIQMNLFRPVFKPESFDLVISNGVLHHTSDPYGGFRSILKLVKKGGFIVVGLYNTYGRIATDVRRFVFRISGNKFRFMDPRLQDNITNTRKRTWFLDQYRNPHESKHSIDEVLRWFDDNGVDFVSSIPKPSLFNSFEENEKLFVSHPRESKLEHLLVQLRMMFSGAKEGGLFIMIGRKKA